MIAHANKTQENHGQAVANENAQKQLGNESAFQFIDNRPETIAQINVQEMANNSPQVKQLKAFCDIANNSPQAKQASRFHAVANNHCAPGIQKQEEELQMKSFADSDAWEGSGENAGVDFLSDYEGTADGFSAPPSRKPENVGVSSNPNNNGLPAQLRAGIEQTSGIAMEDVKVHYDSAKPAQFQAHAFAKGSDIHIAPGQEKHLAHEAWHVVQQKQGRVQPDAEISGEVVNRDPGLEREADQMGARAMQLRSNSPRSLQQKMIGSPVSVFKMVPKDDDEHTYVWHYQNQAQEGEYRFLANLVGQGIIYYKKSQISEQQGRAATTQDLQQWMAAGHIVKGAGRKEAPEPFQTMNSTHIDLMVNSLKEQIVRRRPGGGPMGQMGFRFPIGTGQLYYFTEEPPVDPQKHSDVEFIKVSKEQLEEERAHAKELAPQHYPERLMGKAFVYVRDQSGDTISPRNERSVYRLGQKAVSAPEQVTAQEKKVIIETISQLSVPIDQVEGKMSMIKKKGRGDGQDAAMRNINASAYALALGDPNAAATDWEWLHLRGAALGGGTNSTNLVLGTKAANSHMIAFEKDIEAIAKLATTEQPLLIRWRAGGFRNTHEAEWISIEIEARNGLQEEMEGGRREIMPKQGFVRYVFNPKTAAILDRVDRDLHWGKARLQEDVRAFKQPVFEPQMPISQSSSSQRELMPYQGQQGESASFAFRLAPQIQEQMKQQPPFFGPAAFGPPQEQLSLQALGEVGGHGSQGQAEAFADVDIMACVDEVPVSSQYEVTGSQLGQVFDGVFSSQNASLIRETARNFCQQNQAILDIECMARRIVFTPFSQPTVIMSNISSLEDMFTFSAAPSGIVSKQPSIRIRVRRLLKQTINYEESRQNRQEMMIELRKKAREEQVRRTRESSPGSGAPGGSGQGLF